MRVIELAVLLGALITAAVVGMAIAATWTATHTVMLLLIFGIAFALAFAIGGAAFAFIVGMRVTRPARASNVQQPAQVIGGMGRPLPPPPALLGGPGATSAGSYNSLGNYSAPVMSEPWREVD